MVARSIVETAQSIATDQECASLLEIVSKLADDSGGFMMHDACIILVLLVSPQADL